MTWNYVTSKTGDFNNINYDPTTNIIYMFAATKFFKYDCASETITSVTISSNTKYGQTYTPDGTSAVIFNGDLYMTKHLDITAYAPNPQNKQRDIIQVYKVDITTGGLTLVFDSWDSTGISEQIAFWDEEAGAGGTVPTTCPPSTTYISDYKRSNLKAAALVVHAGKLWLSMLATYYETYQCHINDPIPALDRYVDTRQHCTLIYGYAGTGWTKEVTLPDNGDTTPTGYTTTHYNLTGIQADISCSFNLEYISGVDDSLAYTNSGAGWWTPGASIHYVPTFGALGEYWQIYNGQDLYSLDATWETRTLYNTYTGTALTTSPPPWNLVTNDNLFLTTVDSYDEVSVYYDTTLDATITPYNSTCDGIIVNYAVATLFGDYVVFSHDTDCASARTIEVWKRAAAYGLPIKPKGMDIQSLDNVLVITANLITLSGTLSHGAFVYSLETASMASGVRYFAYGSGWLYPRAADSSVAYLYGTIGPQTKCLVYSGAAGISGIVNNQTLTTLSGNGYISGLQPYATYTPNDFTFTYINPSGQEFLGYTTNSGLTYTNMQTTRFPAQCLYRTTLTEAPGYTGTVTSGDAQFIGASGVYSIPADLSVDFGAFENRGDGLPAVTITDIDSAGYSPLT